MSLIERAVQRMATVQRLDPVSVPPPASQAMRRRSEDVRNYLQGSPLTLVQPAVQPSPAAAAPAAAGPSWRTCAVIALASLGLGAGIMRIGMSTLASSAGLSSPDATASSVAAPVGGAATAKAKAKATASTATATATATAPPRPAAAAASTVHQWAAAWSARDAERYLGFYGPEFVPPAKLSRRAWEEQRRARLRAARSITVWVEDLNVEMLAVDRAIARFVQTYEADHYRELRTPKVLVLAREGEVWRIASETRSC